MQPRPFGTMRIVFGFAFILAALAVRSAWSTPVGVGAWALMMYIGLAAILVGRYARPPRSIWLVAVGLTVFLVGYLFGDPPPSKTQVLILFTVFVFLLVAQLSQLLFRGRPEIGSGSEKGESLRPPR